MSDFNVMNNQFASLMAEQFKLLSEQYAPKAPEVKFNKNGYEIRSEVLDLAKQFTEFEFSSKWMGFEQTVERDKDGRMLTKVDMPEVPGVDKVLKTAEAFYNFINNK